MSYKFLLAITFAILISLISFKFFSSKDNIVCWASQSYPLDNEHPYLLKKNDGNEQIPAGVTYVIVPANAENMHVDFGVSGAVIGKTDIDLEPFIGKIVSIEGTHYDATPLLLSTDGVPEQYISGKMAVIHVKNVWTRQDSNL